jgi:hypothetical protein
MSSKCSDNRRKTVTSPRRCRARRHHAMEENGMSANLHARLHSGALSLVILCAGCKPVRPPPPSLFFGGLPVSGDLTDARRAGFNICFNLDAIHMRCRRNGVMLENQGPYEAAVDLEGGYGEGGFDQLTLWHDRDNHEVFKIADALMHRGWKRCYTGDDRWGDQAIYTREGSSVRVSMDLSFWGKRRIRIIPEWNKRERRCIPEDASK